MSNNKDREIKNRLNNVNELPKNIDDSIENTLKILKKRKKKKNYKKVIILVSAICICIGSYSIKGNADRNKVYSNIFNSFQLTENYKNIGYESNKKFENIAVEGNVINESNKKIEKKEYDFRLEALVYDGYTLTVGYEINEAIEVPSIMLEIDGEIYDGNGYATSYVNEEGKTITIRTFQLFADNKLRGNRINKYIGKRAKEFEITLRAQIDEEWFEVKEMIRTNHLKENIRKVKVNRNINGVRIKNIIITPMNIYIDGYGEKDSIKDEMFEVKEKGGEKIPVKSLTNTSRFGIRDNFIFVYENKGDELEGIEIQGKDKKIILDKEGNVHEAEN
ncbi:DUF4179 domain-containing protein [uncultured Clostridium sp.]|uniref:DUF4179 domain-containing protein n=1 Tax=uncultured Clostridium sp. TaxID=59620 RepID=UPI002604DB32|nr:DUF4179 domain-containing protein [uncultured Clostridium sp.]